ncbi:MAG: hypothetical protein AB1641_02780 [Thermodesulfobacteriota bacterium]
MTFPVYGIIFAYLHFLLTYEQFDQGGENPIFNVKGRRDSSPEPQPGFLSQVRALGSIASVLKPDHTVTETGNLKP